MQGGHMVGEFVVLRGYPHEQNAMKMLREAASLVKPIMHRHKWRLPILTEFWDTPSWHIEQGVLLGYNQGFGQLIALRLRQPYDKSTFLNIDDIVQTMLHELAHNSFGPHDDKFFNFLGELKHEYLKLRASGYNGEGFYYSDGKKLGKGKGYYNPQLTALRRQALTGGDVHRLPQSLKRHKINSPVTVSSSSRPPTVPQLAGKQVQKIDRERIAEAAEKRRREADKCGLICGGDREMDAIIERGISNGIREQPEPLSEDEMAAIMIQIQLLEEAEEEAWGQRKEQLIIISDDEEEQLPLSLYPPNLLSLAGPSPNQPASNSHGQMHKAAWAAAGGTPQWSCSACTLLNSISALECECCETARA